MYLVVISISLFFVLLECMFDTRECDLSSLSVEKLI